jgi:hypothetical protein
MAHFGAVFALFWVFLALVGSGAVLAAAIPATARPARPTAVREGIQALAAVNNGQSVFAAASAPDPRCPPCAARAPLPGPAVPGGMPE